jgi:hypothetical protein
LEEGVLLWDVFMVDVSAVPLQGSSVLNCNWEDVLGGEIQGNAILLILGIECGLPFFFDHQIIML